MAREVDDVPAFAVVESVTEALLRDTVLHHPQIDREPRGAGKTLRERPQHLRLASEVQRIAGRGETEKG